jgi:hypothetical protein
MDLCPAVALLVSSAPLSNDEVSLVVRDTSVPVVLEISLVRVGAATDSPVFVVTDASRDDLPATPSVVLGEGVDLVRTVEMGLFSVPPATSRVVMGLL